MLENLREILNGVHPWLIPGLSLAGLLLLAWIVDLVAKRQFVKLAQKAAEHSRSPWDDLLVKHGVIRRFAQLIPPAAVYIGAPLIPELGLTLTTILQNVALAYIALVATITISAALNVVNDLYNLRAESHKKPIKGYLQLLKIILFCIGFTLVIAALIDKSPLLLLSGFGALTAIMLLVFKDTILSLVASIQLSGLDMVRVGDWIEMPQFNADGDVIDVALHTVRVQNWDKTITTIPTHRLITDSFRNWRGMSESGGRRIKRSLLIDMQTARFLSDDELEHFKKFALLATYIDTKHAELADYNSKAASATVNLRRLTNIGTFRTYVYNYLKNHPDIHDSMTLLVRQLAPQPEGIPIEIYCFTKTTNWNEYEDIQGDIFDHLLAILEEFGLKAYQQPSGADLAQLAARR